MPTSDHSFRCRLGPRHVNDEVGDQVAHVEPMIEPIGEGAEVGLGVLAVLQRLEGARHHGLKVAQHGVDPFELGQAPGLECAHHPGHVDASGLSDRGKTPQAVTGDAGLGQQAGLGPLGNSIKRAAADQVELERQGRDIGFGLTDEVDGQEPDRQRQLGVFYHRASGQRGLKAVTAALVELAGALHRKIALRDGAPRTAKPVRPAHSPEHLGALRFGAEVVQKLRNRLTVLVLNLVAGNKMFINTGAHYIDIEKDTFIRTFKIQSF